MSDAELSEFLSSIEFFSGFSRADCEPITTAGSKIRVKWAGDAELENYLRAGTVRLKLYLEKATVYGFHCVTGDN